jgi:RHS repeat-associated protein
MRSEFAIPTQTVTLNQGETYLLRDLALGRVGGASDLTGSTINSTKPVAVFGGNRAAFVPSQYFAADHLVEQLPPTNTWGREFVTMPLVTGSTRGDRFRFLAQADGTQVSIDGTAVATLNRGEFYEQVVIGPAHVVANKPILVAQYAHSQNYYRTDPGANPNFQGDPFMMIVPPFEQFLSNYTVSTPALSSTVNAQRFDRNYINIVAPEQAVGRIEIDGVPVAANKYTAIGTSGFFGVQVPIALGAYNIAGPLPFGVFVYGFGSFDSYGYVGGQSLSPVASVGSVVLTPATANPPINSTLTLTARVADFNGSPLAGVRVDFDVSGVNPKRGFGFSDANGLVAFSYTGVRDGRDIVTSSVGPLLDDSIIDWRVGALAPQVFVSAPLDGSSIAAGTTLVASGIALADFPLATLDLVTVNGTPVTSLDAAGNFFVSLYVGPGDNEFEFAAIDSNGQTGSKIITIHGMQRSNSQVDFTQFSDVTGSFKQSYARSYFHQSNRTLLAETAIENAGQYPADVPLLVGIANISDPMVQVRDADGQTPDGIPYYDFTGLVTGGSLKPRSRTGFFSAEFFNPNQAPFTYDIVFYGKLNEPPQITSLPPTEVDLDREYRYDVIATDPNNDAIAFELAEAPAGMTIDKDNGQIRWLPSATDSGLHTVDIRVFDTRAGQSNQRFVLSARLAPPNRSPIFTSLPIAIAEVGKPYPYVVQANDADSDTLRYRLVNPPPGMTILPTGEIRWQPTPAQLGNQNVVIEASDARGGAAQQSFSLLVLSPSDNSPPVIVSSPPTAIKLGPFSYQVIVRDSDDESLSFHLLRAPVGMSISSTGLINWVSTVAQLGAHSVAIEVLDTRGGRDAQSFSMAVFDDADPIITSQSVVTAQINSNYIYQVTATDAIDDVLSFKLINAPIGMTIQPSSGLIEWNVTNAAYETEPIVVEVSDGRGGLAIQSFSIAVTGGQSQAFNINPFYVSAPPTRASVGTTLLYAVQARDPDGDPLSFDLPLGPKGMVIDSATGRLGWLPQANQAGMQQVVIRVQDNHGGIWLQSFQIDVDASNTGPVITSSPLTNASIGTPWEYRLHVQDADNDSLMFELVSSPNGMTLTRLTDADANALLRFTPTVAGSVDVNLFVRDGRGGKTEQRFSIQVTTASANMAPIIDSAPRLTIPAGQPWAYLVSVEDPNGDPTSISLPVMPVGMTLDASLRALSWTPTLAQLGSHSVSLFVADGRGGSIAQTFNLSVVSNSENHAPSIVSPPSAFRATVGEPFAYVLRAADEDGDPAEWTLVESPHGASLDRRYGTLHWIPSLDQLGLQRFVISAKDPIGLETQQSFSLLVSGANLSPSILSSPPSEAVAQERYVYGVRAIDPENDPLTFGLVSGPVGMSIDAARGIVRWTPMLGQLGTADATVEVTDTRGNKSTQSFQINVTEIVRNREPIITSRASFRARVDALYQYDVSAVDPEGTAISYSLVSAPAGMQIDAISGLITWIPTTAQAGSHLVQVAAQDTAGGRSIQRFAILARINQAPTITSTAVTSVALGGLYHYDLQVNDPDGDPLSYALVTGPAGLSIDALGRVLWQTAPGVVLSNPVVLRVTDSFGAVATQSYTLAVTPDTTAPKVELRLSANPLVLGENSVIVVQASDNVGVVDIKFTMDGRLLVLDANRSVTLRGDKAGLYVLRATVRDASGNEGVDSLTLRVFDPADTQGPTIRITSPQANTKVTTLTDIVGSITDDNLQFYRIDYGRADLVDVNLPDENDPDYKTLTASNANAVDKVLATFDPTLLINDDYVIRILAKDLTGNVSAKTISLSLDGQLKLGEFNLDFTDLSIPVAGIPITVTRSYDTRNANEQRDFGYGWTLSVSDPQIRETIPLNPLEKDGLFFAATPFREGTRVYLTNPEGRRVGFTFKPTRQFSLFGGGSFAPTFVSDPGVSDKLDVGSVPLRKIGDAFYSGFFGDPFNPSAYRLTTKSGVVYEYGQFSGLSKVTDRNGNRLEFTSEGISSSAGPGIRFMRDPTGRIEKIIDPSGNTINYRYGTSGDLLSIEDQVGLKTQHTYLESPPHFLETITDPRGKIIFKTRFDAQGRLTSNTDALGNTIQKTYDPATLSESVVDAAGKTTNLTYDDRGNVISVKDPLGAVRSFTYDSENNALTVTDPLGKVLKRVFDDRGNIVSMKDPLGKVSRSTFTAKNQVSSATDAMGHTGTLVYDDRGQLIQFINAVGQSSSFQYDLQGRKTSFVDNLGIETRYEYGTGPRPTKVLFADGMSNQFQYDRQDRITREVDERGNETTYSYDATGRPLSQRDAMGGLVLTSYAGPNLDKIVNANGGVTRFEYDDAGRRTKEIDANGGAIVNQYNGNNQLAKRIDPTGDALQYDYRADGRVASVTDSLGNKTAYGYDATGNRTSVTDANGNVWRYEYDALGRVVKKFDAMGAAEVYAYDAAGRMTSVTDRGGSVMRYEYDALGRVVQIIDALGGVASATFNAAGQLKSQTDPMGNTTQFLYDRRGRLSQTIDAAGGIRTTTYDEVGNIVAQTDELGKTTRFEYDPLRRLIKQTDPLGNFSTNTYDASGNIVSSTDPLGRTTKFTVDAMNQLLSTTDPEGNATRYTYDSAGHRTSVTDPLGQVTRFQYDAANRLVSRIDPLGNASSMVYDAVGNLKQTVDRNGRKRSYAYDVNNQLIREDWLSESGAVVHSIASTYGADGAIASAADSDSSYTYSYDTIGRVTAVDNIGTPNVPRLVLSYTYDALGNRLATSDNLGVRVDATYNNRNLLASQTWSGTGIVPVEVDFQYDAKRQRTGLQRFSDVSGSTLIGKTLQSYDAAGRLLQLTHRNATDAAISEFDYTYDKASQVISESSFGQSSSYTYDLAGQLKSANHLNRPSQQFSYDSAGNRSSSNIVMGANNRIQSDGNFTYAFDKEGNMIQKTNIAMQNVTRYSYDYRNRLTAVRETNAIGAILSQVRYTYDVFDRRISSITDSETQYTVYDRDRVWADFNSAGGVAARYLYGPNVDELLARQRPNDGVTWYLTDRLGSVRDMANATGGIVNHIEYDAFGGIVSESNPQLGDRFKYTGREWDSASGLYNYRARYYMPELGIFMSEDPIGFCAGDANLRRYVGNRVTNATDPSGMFAISEFGAILAAQVKVVTTLIEFGGDDPYTFRVGGKAGRVGVGGDGDFSLSGPLDAKTGLGGKLNATNPAKSKLTFSPGTAAFNNGDGGIANKAGAKAADAAWKRATESEPEPVPFPGAEFQFLVESTAYKKSYFDHFLARFNVAIFGGAAEELNLIAKVAVTNDSSTLVEVRDQAGIWKAHGFATLTPSQSSSGRTNTLGDGGPPPPDGGFGFAGTGPSPGAGNSPDGDGDRSGGGGGCCCCSDIYIVRSYLEFAYAQIWKEPTIVRLGLQPDNEDLCLYFADQQFVYAKSIRRRLNTNR